MIAIDNQPFSKVDDRGFIELSAKLESRCAIPSTKYLNETMLQQAYDSPKLKITKVLLHASFLSFTRNMSKNSTTNESYTSLTAHWLNENFEFKNRVRIVGKYKVSTLAKNICNHI